MSLEPLRPFSSEGIPPIARGSAGKGQRDNDSTPHKQEDLQTLNLEVFKNHQFNWLRGLDLNQRPLGYERPEISVSIGQQGTSGNPEIPLGTAGNRVLGT
jgi:hypothetical protein